MNSNKNIKVSNVSKDIIELNKKPKNNKLKKIKNVKKPKKSSKEPKTVKINQKSFKRKNKNKVAPEKPIKVSFSLKKNKVKRYFNPNFKDQELDDNDDDNDFSQTTNFGREFKIEELPDINIDDLFN